MPPLASLTRPLARVGVRALSWATVVAVTAGLLALVEPTIDTTTAAAANLQPGSGQYFPVTSTRISSQSVAAGKASPAIDPRGLAGIPTKASANTTAVSLQLTVVSPVANGTLLVYPDGNASTSVALGYRTGVTETVHAIARLGAAGFIVKNTGTKAANIRVDVIGYWQGAGTATAGSTYVPLSAPQRVISQTTVASGLTNDIEIDALAPAEIPDSGVTAVMAEVIVSNDATAAGRGMLYPNGEGRHGNHDFSFLSGVRTLNAFPVKLGTDGRVKLGTAVAGTESTVTARVSVDILGYFRAGTATGSGDTFSGLAKPLRAFTWSGTNATTGALAAGATRSVKLTGMTGGPPAGADAVALDLSGTSSATVDVTVFPGDVATPSSYPSLINIASATALRTSMVWVRLDSGGNVKIKNNGNAAATLYGDIVGYFSKPTVPGIPAIGTVQALDRSVNVSWTRPSDGGSAITSYTITASPGGASATVDGNDTSGVVTGLANGTSYTFKVKATNDLGTGAASAASASVTPKSVPGAPGNVRGTVGDAKVTVAWDAPADDGGSAITKYTVTASPGGATATTTGGTSVDVTGLANGNAYSFSVVAENSVGVGPASTPSPTYTPMAVPGRPQDLQATAGDQSADLTWAAPVSNGGSSITEYRVRSTPATTMQTFSAASTSGTFTGLANGTAYTFVISAVNAAGEGAASDPSASVTPSGLFELNRAGVWAASLT